MLNRVMLIGYAGAEPEVRTLESGVKMARLRVATSERIYNSTNEQVTYHTEWHTIVLWRAQAEFAQNYVKKGSQVYVEGRLRSREVSAAQTVGAPKQTLVEILGDSIKVLGTKAQEALSDCVDNVQQKTINQTNTVQLSNDPDDIPF